MEFSNMSGKRDLQAHLAEGWSRLGVTFNAAPARRTPDLEMLLVETVHAARKNSRLLILAATWVFCYGDYVAKRRLALMVSELVAEEDRPVMGLLLDWVRSQNSRHQHRFDEVILQCKPAGEPGPLLDINRGNPILRALSEERASKESRRWGCWMEAFEPKLEAIRPPEWVAKHNPSLAIRALCGGDLVATIAADMRAGTPSLQSESALARRYGASRSAVRDALRKLKLAGVVRQFSHGKSRPVALADGIAGF
ncbi:MAG TPA: hypothetical protein VGN88_07510 [Phycisphaerae bacterium]